VITPNPQLSPSGTAVSPAVPIAGNPEDDAIRAQRLASMKRTATLMLAGCAVIFVVSRILEGRWPWLAYLTATAEAAMVGGIADWFAVTALFRHPMGIPIPHTAIIPARKAKIGTALGRFVQNNFLSHDVISRRVSGMRPGERVATWVSEPGNARRIARHVGTAVSAASEVLSDDEVSELIHKGISSRARSMQVAPLLGKILELLTEEGRHQRLLDEGIGLAARAAIENQRLIRKKVSEESPWWIPPAVDRKIFEKIVEGIERTLEEVSKDPDHPLRHSFDDALYRFARNLRTSPEVIARAEQWKAEAIAHPAVREFATSLWSDAKATLQTHIDRPPSAEPQAVERGLVALGQAVLDDPELLEKVDHWITDGLVWAVDQYRGEVGQLIEQTIGGWDPDATSRKIELQIGRDLQYIRINGTLVGGLVGLLLHILSKFF
jgi:uncharacterized membrane-anchored protein YjiN (DUF445 family)